jgi:ribonuclease D
MLIQTLSQLDDALADLGRQPFLTLDTEFMRESTYYPKLCLIQAANASACVLLDPLALPTLQPLFAQLAGRSQVKILHAARQDLEVLGLSSGAPPAGPIFDTQIAAGLLGLPAQIGYGDLVFRRLGVALTKGHARTDWTRRPLSDEQLAYAADDVRYLVPLYENLCDALLATGRMAWLEEETRLLENPDLYRIMPAEAWKRLKGLERLQPGQRAAAKALAQWREERAMKHDKPRGWILHDDTLRSVAETLPDTLDALGAARGMPSAVVRKYGQELLDLVRNARDNSGSEAPAFRPSRPESEELALVKRVSALIRDIGEQLGLSPELLATRRDVEQLVYGGEPGVFLRGWRKDVIGDQVMSLVNA